MRHRMAGRQFGRNSGHRRALLRNLTIALVEHERLETTVPKAKELRRVADRLVSWGKSGTLHARRMAQSVLQQHGLVVKLFSDIAPRMGDRPGGYTRIIKTRRRVGDGAPMAMIELVCANPPAPRRRRATEQGQEEAAQAAAAERPSEEQKAKAEEKKAKAGKKA
ncbi:MAG: 50S ribosomal protein L17 [Nitrospirae bacterium]|nr:50S ribosomal protein L17 [Nitrospirota bacterium]